MRYFFVFLLMAGLLKADTISVYAIRAEVVNDAAVSALKSRGKESKVQPILNTNLLRTSGTEYYLLVISPKDLTEKGQVDTVLSSRKMELYQVYEFLDRRVTMTVDNSEIIDVNRDWLKGKQ